MTETYDELMPPGGLVDCEGMLKLLNESRAINLNHTAPSAGGPFRAVTSWWSTSSLSLLYPLVSRTSMSPDRYRLSELFSTRVVWHTHLSDPISAQYGPTRQ
jgi:hypothetical protein